MAMSLISTTTVGSGGAASIEFTNIPQTGKDLLVLFSTRQNASAIFENIEVHINGSQANQLARWLRGTGSTVSSTNSTEIYGMVMGNANTSTSNTFGNGSLYFSNYATTNNKSVSGDFVTENNATDARQIIGAGAYNSSTAISTLLFNGAGYNFLQYSTIGLYIIS